MALISLEFTQLSIKIQGGWEKFQPKYKLLKIYILGNNKQLCINYLIKRRMKKMKFLVSQLYMLALLVLPFISSSCSDDDDPKVEITLGIEDGATVNVGQILSLIHI